MDRIYRSLILVLILFSAGNAQDGLDWFGASNPVSTMGKIPTLTEIPAGQDSVRVQFSPKAPMRRVRLVVQGNIDDTTAVKSGCGGYSFALESDSTWIAWRYEDSGCGPILLRGTLMIDSSDDNQHGIAVFTISTKSVNVTINAVTLANSIETPVGLAYNGTSIIPVMSRLMSTTILNLSTYNTLPNGGRSAGWQVWQNTNITVRLRDSVVVASGSTVDLRVYVPNVTDSTNLLVLSTGEKANASSGWKTAGNWYRHKQDTARGLYASNTARVVNIVAAQITGGKVYEVPLAYTGSEVTQTGNIATPVNQALSVIIPNGHCFMGGMNSVSIANASYYMGHFYFGSSSTVVGDRFDDDGYGYNPLVHVLEMGH